MVAEILAVGTEILLGDIVNTNAQFISQALAGIGVTVYFHTAVGDNAGRLLQAYQLAFLRADTVIATGGLGPTEDDITKEVAAEYFGVPLELHEPSWELIKGFFSRASLSMTENNQKQAMMPKGCRVFPNRNGTAPGVCIERDGKTLIILPGPPNECEPMVRDQVIPYLREKTDGVFVSRTIKVLGVGESMAAHMLSDMLHRQTNPTIAPYAKTAEVWLRITASAKDDQAARELIAPVADEIYKRLGGNIYGEDDDTLAGAVVRKLSDKGLTLACAESCTGGMLTSRLVDCPGVSEVLKEGIIAYDNEAKVQRLGVKRETIETYGAVSAETAAAMAEGAAHHAGSQVGLSTTGIAGPGGGTPDKPVGLVYIGLYVQGKGTLTKELRLSGDRAKIRARAVVTALDLLRREIYI